MNARHAHHGISRIDTVIVLVVVCGSLALGLLVVVPAFKLQRRTAYRMVCSGNLMRIGKAMMTYADDYDGALPAGGTEGTIWGPGLHDWKAKGRDEAFGSDANGGGGQATISSSLFLLVKYGGLSPELFVCWKDKRTSAFWPKKHGIAVEELAGVWDFGPNPAEHCSYAYHMPFSQYSLKTSVGPSVPVAADRNPWIDGPWRKAGEFSQFTSNYAPFKGSPEEARQGNSKSHGCDGQNVLFIDTHVEFAKWASCGLEDDNIYTSWDGDNKMRGVPPKAYESLPAHELDSLLVNDPPLER